MLLILLLLAIFVWTGLTAERVDRRVMVRMVALILATIATDFALLWR